MSYGPTTTTERLRKYKISAYYRGKTSFRNAVILAQIWSLQPSNSSSKGQSTHYVRATQHDPDHIRANQVEGT